jgi:hypothetical protein
MGRHVGDTSSAAMVDHRQVAWRDAAVPERPASGRRRAPSAHECSRRRAAIAAR